MRRLTAIALFLLAGCAVEYEASPTMTEPGKVSKLVYMPSGHGSDIAVGFGSNGNGGMTTTITPVNIDIPARYGIVFECQHGSFAIEGDKWLTLWKSLHEGQQVTIQYREIYRIETAKNERKRKLHKLDFLWAVPVNATPTTNGPPASPPRN